MKRLTMSLLFRGKPLSYMRQGVDFNRRLRVGRDPALFWQVLCDDFPLRHTLLQREGDGFRLRRRREWTLRIDGKSAPGDLTIRPGVSGDLAFNKDWAVRFEWDDERRRAPTQADLALRRQYARRAPLSAEQRFTRVFLLAALAVTAAGILLVRALTPTVYVQRHITDLVRDYDRAELVQVTLAPAPVDYTPTPVDDDLPVPAGDAPADRPLASVGDLFGFDPYAVPQGDMNNTALGEHDLLEVNTGAAITTTAGGARTLNDGEAASWFESRSSDQNAVFAESDLGDLHTRDIAVGGDGLQLQKVDIASLTESTTSFNIITLDAGAAVSPAVRERFQNITPIDEAAVEVNAPATQGRGDLAMLRSSVNTYRRQIETLFRVESAVTEMHGSLQAALFIAEDGQVRDAQMYASEGSVFSESFLRKARDLLLSWRLPVDRDTVYEFRMTFMQ